MNEKRLTHAQIRSKCPTEDRKDFVTCPVSGCGGHLHLFGTDDFACMGNSSHAPCRAEDVAAKLWAMIDSGAPDAIQKVDGIPKTPPGPPTGRLELAEYGIAKHLSADLLTRWFGATEGKHPYYDKLERAVCFPYWNERGEEVTQQWRWGMGGKERRFLANKPTYLYGGRFLRLLEQMAEAGKGRPHIFLVEGESNTHTLAQNSFPVLGLPGVQGWQPEWADLKCLQAAKIIYFFLDMKDGTPESAAILGARKVAESFEPGKVLAVKLSVKDVSELWLWHMTEVAGGGVEGFRSDLQDAILAATPVIPVREEIEGKPADLSEQVLGACPILREFVALTLPKVETDVNNLVCDFLACAGAAIGLKAYAMHAFDKHPPATYHLLIGNTSIGKGTAFNCASVLFGMVEPNWKKCIRHSARSVQSLYRALYEVSAERVYVKGKTDSDDGDAMKDNPDYTGGRLLLRFPEVSAVFKSMRAEWSTLSQGLREVFDGGRVSNERGQKDESIRVDDPYAAAVLGDVTPWELSEVIEGVDFANGVANRFIWCRAYQTKTLTRVERMSDYSDLAERLRRVIPTKEIGEVKYSSEGAAAWDTWVYSLPVEDGGKLGSACGRMRANGLRLCVLFAVLDESRLAVAGPPKIEARHVQAAAAILDRHRATVAWFLARPAAMPESLPENGKGKLWQQIEKVRGALKNGRITDNQLHNLLSHQTVDERAAIAGAAGLHHGEEVDGKGTKFGVWR